MTSNYLGTKGYTVPKAALSPAQLRRIQTDLTIQPRQGPPGAQGAGAGYGPPPVSFPVYRETADKVFLPHYYGTQHFGPPAEVRLPVGDDIDVPFQGTLRDYQAPVVDAFLAYLRRGGGYGAAAGLLELPCAWGKTSASLYMVSQWKKKTLVIVHKEFLLNQWCERIQQFLPQARVGRIQGAIQDVEDKDIVLCMLQSLVLKDYPASLFRSFGLTILDEVHHISSQTFSQALFKVITRSMLGLSATMERKDGTTHVFKMFLGDIVHKVERAAGEHAVEVRAVTYRTGDEEFNETILDFRGQAQISSMISKVCSYTRRTEFALRVLDDFLRVPGTGTGTSTGTDASDTPPPPPRPPCELCQRNQHALVRTSCCDRVVYCLPCLEAVIEQAQRTPRLRPKCPHCRKVLAYEQHFVPDAHRPLKPLAQAHVLVMAHNLNILEYLYRAIVCRNLASVDYYVGGRSEAALKRAETKQVLLATYSMAAEGLDIPTLNTQFLLSPKTDVVQIVGRILRAKHRAPVIYDFCDTHDVFQRQWAKRRAYYKKQHYRIVSTNNHDYRGAPVTGRVEPGWKLVWAGGAAQSSATLASDDDTEVEEADEVASNSQPLVPGLGAGFCGRKRVG